MSLSEIENNWLLQNPLEMPPFVGHSFVLRPGHGQILLSTCFISQAKPAKGSISSLEGPAACLPTCAAWPCCTCWRLIFEQQEHLWPPWPGLGVPQSHLMLACMPQRHPTQTCTSSPWPCASIRGPHLCSSSQPQSQQQPKTGASPNPSTSPKPGWASCMLCRAGFWPSSQLPC